MTHFKVTRFRYSSTFQSMLIKKNRNDRLCICVCYICLSLVLIIGKNEKIKLVTPETQGICESFLFSYSNM